MASGSTSSRTICYTCNKEKITYLCQGCSQKFCLDDLPKHRQDLNRELDQLVNDHDELRENLNEDKLDSIEHPVIEQIDQWEKHSIDKIKQAAQQCRDQFNQYFKEFCLQKKASLDSLAQQIKDIRQENEFNEFDLINLKKILNNLQEEFHQPTTILIKQQSTPLIYDVSLLIPSQKNFYPDLRWEQVPSTVAGGNGDGKRLDQLCFPCGFCIDDQNQTIYVADFDNGRIVEWKPNALKGRIVLGENGKGKQTDQVYLPTDVIIDRQDNSFIIADHGNKRVLRWSRQNGQVIVSDIDCGGLAMDNHGFLYVSDWKKNEVRRWKKGEKGTTVVAGGNGQGDQLNQLHFPTYIFVDGHGALYVSDRNNHRVMKWAQNSKEGIVVAGGNGQGKATTQLSSPEGVVVSSSGQIYVADAGNGRVMRWREGATEGIIVVGKNDEEQQKNQLGRPTGLSFDNEGNLYVVDYHHHRVQKYMMISDGTKNIW